MACDPVPLPGLPPVAERSPVWCRLCGRQLRDRASRVWGLGAECRHKLDIRTAPKPATEEVDQDPLPGL